MLAALLTPLRALVVALAGTAIAYLWFEDAIAIAIVVAAALIALSAGLAALGHRMLPKRPKQAVPLLECWIVTQAVVAALAAAAVIIVTITLTLPDETPDDTKEVIGALSTAVTSFLTAAFISWTGDEKDSRLADYVRDAFREHYDRQRAGEPERATARYFKAESVGERWVYSDEYKGIDGWGASARRKRAAGVAQELQTGASDR